MSIEPVKEPIKEPTAEEIEAKREDLAKKIIAGTLTSFPISATLNRGESDEYTVGYRIRVPSCDDDVMIGAKAAMAAPRVDYDDLPFRTKQMIEARATLEILGEGPFEDWVPLVDGRPDFGKMTMKKNAVYELYIEALMVLNRFR
jgi:hypothetical protein